MRLFRLVLLYVAKHKQCKKVRLKLIIQWTMVHEPMSISQEQLDAFRMLLTKEDEPLGKQKKNTAN